MRRARWIVLIAIAMFVVLRVALYAPHLPPPISRAALDRDLRNWCMLRPGESEGATFAVMGYPGEVIVTTYGSNGSDTFTGWDPGNYQLDVEYRNGVVISLTTSGSGGTLRCSRERFVAKHRTHGE